MKQLSANCRRYILYFTFDGVITLFTTGALFQNFLLEKGMSESATGTVVSVIYVTQLLSLLCSSFIVDRIHNVIGVFSLTLLASALPFPFLLFYCRDNSRGFYTVILTVMILFSVTRGLNTALFYKVPYHLFDIRQYGQVVAVSGLMKFLLNAGISLGMIPLLRSADYFFVMRVMFAGCIVSALGGMVSMLKTRPIAVKSPQPTERGKPCSRLRLTDKECTIFFIPNFVRGVAIGIIDCVALFAAYDLAINRPEDRTIIATLCAFSAIAANGLFIVISRPRQVRYTVMAGAVLSLFLPLMLAGHRYEVFLIVYAVVYIGRILMDNAVPVLVTQFVPYEKIGAYTTIRMLTTTAGSALGSGLIGAFLGKISSEVFLFAAGAGQMVCAGVYYWYVKHNTSVNG